VQIVYYIPTYAKTGTVNYTKLLHICRC